MTTTSIKKAAKPEILNRYTSLPILIDLLHNEHITLLSPYTWEDRNDTFYLERYQAVSEYRSVLAICFSLHHETFHHWRVFSSGASGVCIEFDKNKLLKHFPNDNGFRSDKVEYRWLGENLKSRPPLELWPFLKRRPYEDEREFRIIFSSKEDELRYKSVPIDISCIRRITLSPWLPSNIALSVITLLNAIPGCADLDIWESTIINNETWRSAID